MCSPVQWTSEEVQYTSGWLEAKDALGFTSADTRRASVQDAVQIGIRDDTSYKLMEQLQDESMMQSCRGSLQHSSRGSLE